MKLKKGLHNAFFIAGIILFCPGFISKWTLPGKKLHGVWQYRAIFKNGINILTPDKDDTMLIDTKKSIFHYSIKSLNKNLGGTFQLISSPLDSSPYKKSLMFHYKPSGSIRRFHIMLLSNDSFIIREGKTSFHYSKRKP
ncbi:MAG: hypothetical protein EBV15_05510 [Bacteroidetes bacterium]|jgi:hypothetical protein|nr:hypothetical protein [Bacteroidota bacterium]